MDFISYDTVRGKHLDSPKIEEICKSHHFDSPKSDEICKMFIRTGRRR